MYWAKGVRAGPVNGVCFPFYKSFFKATVTLLHGDMRTEWASSWLQFSSLQYGIAYSESWGLAWVQGLPACVRPAFGLQSMKPAISSKAGKLHPWQCYDATGKWECEVYFLGMYTEAGIQVLTFNLILHSLQWFPRILEGNEFFSLSFYPWTPGGIIILFLYVKQDTFTTVQSAVVIRAHCQGGRSWNHLADGLLGSYGLNLLG